MANLSSVYRISADITGLEQGMAKATMSIRAVETSSAKMIAGMNGSAFASQQMIAGMSSAGNSAGFFSTALGKLSPLMNAYTGAAGAYLALNFAKGMLADADAVVKLGERLEFTVGAVRELQRNSIESSVSIESFGSAISFLQRMIGSGDSGATGALRELGLNIEDIRRMSPEDQWFTVAEALSGVEDQTELVRLGTELMGRGFANIIPAIKEGFEEVDHSMDDATAAIDRAGDALGRLWKWVKDLIATDVGNTIADWEETFAQAGRELDGLTLGFLRNNEAAGALKAAQENAGSALAKVESGVKTLKIGTSEYAEVERHLGAQLKASQETLKDRTKAQTEAAAAAKRAFQEEVAEILKMVEAEDKAAESMRQMGWATRDLEQQAALLGKTGREVTAPAITDMATALETYGMEVDTGIAASKSLEEMLERLPDHAIAMQEEVKKAAKEVTLLGRTSEALGDISTILDHIPGQFAEIASVAARAGQSIAENIISHDWIGAAVAGVTGLITILSKIGGPSKEQIAAREEQAKFIRELERTATAQQKANIAATEGSREYATLAIMGRDAMMAIGASAADAERVVKGLLDTQNPLNFAAAMAEVQEALRIQEEAQQTLTETLSRYKFTIEELGPAMQRQQLHEQSMQLFKDWEILTQAGINIEAVTREMSASVSEFVQQAIRTGTEVDPAMRQMLETMIAQGQLFDENGEAITNLEESGIKFAMTMSEGFRALIDEVKKLTDTIRIGLGLAIDETSRRINEIPDMEVNVHYNDPGFGDPNRTEIANMAEGGMGRATGPMLFYTRGNEDFAFSGEGKHFGGGGGTTVNVYNAGSVITENQLKRSIKDSIDEDLRRRGTLRAA